MMWLYAFCKCDGVAHGPFKFHYDHSDSVLYIARESFIDSLRSLPIVYLI